MKFKEKNYQKIGIYGFSLFCLFLVAGVFLYSTYAYYEEQKSLEIINGTVESPGDLYFAYYVNGTITDTMPSQGTGYVLDTDNSNCTNGVNISWNSTSWIASVDYSNYAQESGTTRTKCTLYFVKQIGGTLATTYITSLYSDSSQELIYDGTADNNLRYYGHSPRNYIDIGDVYESDVYWGGYSNSSTYWYNGMIFNSLEECENSSYANYQCTKIASKGDVILYRIIGIMNNVDDGTGTKETRLKIVRDDYIGSYPFDYTSSETYSNDYSTSQLMTMLNDYYYYSLSGIFYITSAQTIDFSGAGISEQARQYIGDAVWNLGGYSSTAVTASDLYTYERGNSVYSGHATTWTGKVGLIYATDWAYATSGAADITRDTCLSQSLIYWYYNDSTNGMYKSNCADTSWLFETYTAYWTITPRNYTSLNAFTVHRRGFLYNYYVSDRNVVRPTMYLKSSVNICSGSGNEKDPFIAC